MEIKKVCFKCKKEKPLNEFYNHPDMPDGTVNKCKDCNKKDNQKNWWSKIDEKKEYDAHRHRYSIQRLFNHKYYMIKRRCTKLKKNGKKGSSAFGKKFLSKELWDKWCREETSYKSFVEVYNTWVQSGFDRKLSPSIDRINNNEGYVIGNLQWLTLSENCKKYNK